MTTIRKAVLSLLAFLIASASLLMAQGTYTQIDVPGATVGTLCFGINTNGDIVGQYASNTEEEDGFILSEGAYTTIAYPGGVGTNSLA